MSSTSNDGARSSDVDLSKVTFVGDEGYQLCREIARVSAGLLPVEHASPKLRRHSDGSLQLRVTPETLSALKASRVKR